MSLLAFLVGVAGIALIAFGVTVAASVLSSRATGGSREGTAPHTAPPPAQPRLAPLAIPADFGWARLNDHGEKSVGYYYRDRTAGPSFHVLFVEDAPLTADELRAMRYRGTLTKRLGAHETMQIPEGLPPDGEVFLREMFAEGGATGTAVLALTPAERNALQLPEHPWWIEGHLR
ncbi:MAG: hypothetical protein ACK6CU_23300 [Deltaproteobacteria bacterium]|jgi:hypothetical protein